MTDNIVLDEQEDLFAEAKIDHGDTEPTTEEQDAGEALFHDINVDDDDSNGIDDETDVEAFMGFMARVSSRSQALSRARLLKAALLRAGVPQVSIELMSGRPSLKDDWNACSPVAVMSHHIASHPTPARPTPGLSLVKTGRSDLPGPLCNGTAGVDLVYRIICMGYANHPGVGGPLTVNGPVGNYSIPRDIGRPYIWGTEYEGGFTDEVWDKTYTNKATGKSMTFREFMGRCNSGLVEGIWDINGKNQNPTLNMDLSGYHMEHKSWALDRKVDRRGYTTQSGRAEVQRYSNIKPLPTVHGPSVIRSAEGKIRKPLAGVKRVQRALNKEVEANLDITGVWNNATTAAYKKFQKRLDNPRKVTDGKPGLGDLSELARSSNRFTLIGGVGKP